MLFSVIGSRIEALNIVDSLRIIDGSTVLLYNDGCFLNSNDGLNLGKGATAGGKSNFKLDCGSGSNSQSHSMLSRLLTADLQSGKQSASINLPGEPV